MKILFVTNNYKPYNGGVVSSIEAFRHELKMAGHQVIIVTLDFFGQEAGEEGVIRVACPLRFKYRGNPIAIPFFSSWQLRKILNRLCPEVVHVHHPFALGAVAARIARLNDIPVVFTHHSQYGAYARYYAPFLKPFACRLTEWCVRHFFKNVDVLIAPSESIAQQLRREPAAPPISVIPSGILPVFINKKRPNKELKSGFFELLTVSRFVPEKNISFLLDALSFLDENFKLTLVGFGSYLPQLEHYAFETCGLSPERVKFVSSPPKKVIADYYRRSHLFLFASTTETQGIVFAESMAAGTPVVAVSAPGARDCVQENHTGFLVKTPEQMAEKIKMLRSNPVLYKKLQSSSWQQAQHYTSYMTTQKLIRLYEGLLQKHSLFR